MLWFAHDQILLMQLVLSASSWLILVKIIRKQCSGFYLRVSSKLCLTFGDSKPILEGYVDADWAGDLDGRKSTSRYLFTFAEGAVSWQSRL